MIEHEKHKYNINLKGRYSIVKRQTSPKPGVPHPRAAAHYWATAHLEAARLRVCVCVCEHVCVCSSTHANGGLMRELRLYKWRCMRVRVPTIHTEPPPLSPSTPKASGRQVGKVGDHCPKLSPIYMKNSPMFVLLTSEIQPYLLFYPISALYGPQPPCIKY